MYVDFLEQFTMTGSSSSRFRRSGGVVPAYAELRADDVDSRVHSENFGRPHNLPSVRR